MKLPTENKEFVHAYRAYIEVWIHTGSLESAKDS